MTQFTQYSDVLFNAFTLHSKRKELVERKQEILDRISEYYNSGTGSILFIGFNPAMLAHKSISVAEVSPSVVEWLEQQGLVVEAYRPGYKYDTVVALDEYLTFAEDEQQQLQMIQQLCGACSGAVITTVKDYKNQDFKDREYSQPAIIKANGHVTAFTEIHDWDQADRNAWQTGVYELSGTTAISHGLYNRRALFFKQLAKFSMDAGASNFLVHKNLMYKSLIKKNYEHVISIQFEQN